MLVYQMLIGVMCIAPINDITKEKKMKKIIALTGLLTSSVMSVMAADLHITIEGIQSNQGNIRIGLFSEQEQANFPNGKETKGLSIPAKKGTMSVKISAPTGVYAATAFHDENKDEELNKVFLLGIPTEPYGFSNDAKAAFSAPSFSQAQFNLPNTGTKIIFEIADY